MQGDITSSELIIIVVKIACFKVIVLVIEIYNLNVMVIVIVIDLVGPVERFFSVGGNVFGQKGGRLIGSVFEKLVNIKCNGHLV